MSTDKHTIPPAAEPPHSAAGDFHGTRDSDFSLSESAPLRFAEAISKVEADRLREGIGTLGEKTLHAVLKHFYEPDPAFHEQKIGSYFADIAKDGRIVEIQTRGLYRLKKKLSVFLQKGYAVTVVHPVPRTRWIYWIDGEGNLSNRRKSPKTGRPHAAAPELASLDELVGTPGLTFVILLLDVEDFRNLDGWGRGGKRGSTRFERMPVTYVEEIRLSAPEDWRRILPEGLPSPFTAARFYQKGGYPTRGGYYALKLFEKLGLVRRAGTQGKAFLYEICEPVDQ
ncbi:MAG: hypothetical protein IJX47_00055 [Clostridia bacterium]|nr:hypothetical protein [Clostridia bacterium]